MVGAVRANQLRDRTLQTYIQAADHALTKGIIIADTKFEFGVDERRQPGAGRRGLHSGLVAVLARRHYQAGRRAAQLRQAVRPQLADRVRNPAGTATATEPPPPLPPDIVDATRDRYIEAYERISGLRFADWIGPTRDQPTHADRRSGSSTAGSITATSSSTRTSGCATSPTPRSSHYLEAENAYTEQVTAHLEPLRQKIFDEIKARTKETDLSVPTRRGDWWYYGRSFEGKQYGVQCRCPVRRSRRLDPAESRRGHRHPR